MIRVTLKQKLLGAALLLGLSGAAFGHGPARHAAVATSTRAPETLDAFGLARALSSAPPELLVVTFDAAEHPLRGATPSTSLGANDDALVANAPRVGRMILVARDPVRADRVARRLMAAGHSVAVLEGGLDAWEQAMRADPPSPAANASAEARARWAWDVALRHAYGDPGAVPAAPVRAVAAPAPAAGGGGGGGRREGC